MFASFLTTVLSVLAIAALAGGCVAVFWRAGKVESGRITGEAIAAMQAQILSIKDKQNELERENARLKTIIETIQAALKTRGIMVTIDGDLVSISSNDGNKTTHRKTVKRTIQATNEDKKEND